MRAFLSNAAEPSPAAARATVAVRVKMDAVFENMVASKMITREDPELFPRGNEDNYRVWAAPSGDRERSKASVGLA